MERIVFKTSEAAANHGGAMEAETISKNAASLKSHTSKRNLMKKIFALAIVMLVIFPITACSSNSSNSSQTQAQSITINKNLIGVWEEADGRTLVFFDNGTYYAGANIYNIIDYGGGNYSIYENIIMLTRNSGGSSLCTFSISGDTLTLLQYGSEDNENNRRIFKKVK